MRRAFALWSVLVATVPAQAEEPRSQPNVVFFLVDDLGWTDIGCFGSSFYETPNVDSLAAGGIRFTNAYAACPVCSPTRASILTGQYPVRQAITTYISPNGGNQPERWRRNTRLLPASYSDRLPLEDITLAELLRDAGYATFFAGKWHLGPEGFWPEDQGIERGGPYGGKKYFSPYGNPRLTDGPDGEHLPARLASEACSFIEANRDRPFLAYVSFYSVHTPLMAREDLREKYQGKRDQLPSDREVWGRQGKRKERLVQDHAVYAGMVEAMDQAVGDVLAKLEELSLVDDTIVVFMSDNGGLSTSEGHPTSNLPLRAGKGWLYEGGVREPMIVRYPRAVAGGGTCDQPVISTDFLPTLMEMTGTELPEAHVVDGVSLMPALRGEELAERPLFWHFPHYGNQGGSPGAAIRRGRHKLIELFEDGAVELYDLEVDPSESTDLAEKEPELCAALLAELHAWHHEVGARFPAPNPKFDADK